MELSQEVKNNLVNRKLSELKVKEFQLGLDRLALAAVNDQQGIAVLDSRIAAVQAAYKAVEGELVHADTEPTDTGGRSEPEADS